MDRPSALNAVGLPFVFDRLRVEGTVQGPPDKADEEYEAGRPVRIERSGAVPRTTRCPRRGRSSASTRTDVRSGPCSPPARPPCARSTAGRASVSLHPTARSTSRLSQYRHRAGSASHSNTSRDGTKTSAGGHHGSAPGQARTLGTSDDHAMPPPCSRPFAAHAGRYASQPSPPALHMLGRAIRSWRPLSRPGRRPPQPALNSIPGRAPASSPSSNTGTPDTIVSPYPSTRWISRRPPAGRSATISGWCARRP